MELVHAVREPYYIEIETWNWPTFGYFDEGFAEYIAQLAEPGKTGFPFYGFSESAVVGDMVLRGQLLPHDSLRNHHEALNDLCNLPNLSVKSFLVFVTWMKYMVERKC